MILHDKLQDAGFSEIEAKIYVSLLSLGNANLSTIAKKAGLNHVTTLFNLRTMEKKKLLHVSTALARKRYFINTPVQGLRFYLQKLEDDLKEKREAIYESLEGFDIQYKSLQDKPDVKFIEGPDSARVIHAEVQNTVFDEEYEFTNLDEAYKMLPRKKGDHRSQFRKLKKRATILYLSASGKEAPFPPSIKRIKCYALPKEEFDFPGEIATFGDKTVLISLTPRHLGVIIRDESIAKTMRQLFQLALKNFKKPKKGKKKQRFSITSTGTRMQTSHAVGHEDITDDDSPQM